VKNTVIRGKIVNFKELMKWEKIKMIPILLFIGIMPLVVRLKIVHLPNVEEVWLPTPLVYSDLFNYYKARLIFLSAVLAIIMCIVGWVLGKVEYKIERLDYAAFIFISVVLISSLLTNHKNIVFWGYAERWHGLATWLSYFIMYLYVRLNIKTSDDIKNVLRIILGFGIIMASIGTMQFVGADPFRLDFIKMLILPRNLLDQFGLESLAFTFEKNRVYMTLYNPNNVGLYVAAILPICFKGFSLEDKRIMKALWIGFAILLLVSLVGSYSRTGIVVSFISFILFGLWNLNVIAKYSKQIIVLLITLSLILLVGNSLSGNVLANRLLDSFSSHELYTEVDDIRLSDNGLEVQYNGSMIKFDLNDVTGLCDVLSENDEQVITRQDENGYFQFEKSEYSGLSYGYGTLNEGEYYIIIKAQNKDWKFTMDPEGFKFINDYGKFSSLVQAESMFFDGKERLGSNRGYIWSRSLPLAKRNLLIGNGPDSYTFEFPQKDYITLMNVFGDTQEVVDKPHNQYIGLLIEFGILGLSAFITWVGLCLWKGRKNIMSVGLLSILLSFVFYDIAVSTGWILIVCMGMLANEEVIE